MIQPLITVVIPVFRTEQYLRKCMDSVIKQTYRNLEIILVDDDSPDNCPQLCDEYAREDDRVKVIHKSNGGVASAKNAGIDGASGDYIGFVDSDDWIEPDMYECLLELGQKCEAEIVMCGYIQEDGIKRASHPIKTGVLNQKETVSSILMPNRFDGFTNNKLFSCRLLQDVDANGQMLKMRDDIFCEDLLYLCQLVKKTEKVAYTTKQCYHYLIRTDSETGSISKRRMTELAAKAEVIDILESIDTIIPKALYANSAGSLLCSFYQSKVKDKKILRAYRREARKYYREFKLAGFPMRHQLRLLGVILCPWIFCRVWNLLKAIRKALHRWVGGGMLSHHKKEPLAAAEIQNE